MQIVLNSRGAFLRKKENRFVVRSDDGQSEVSADKVSRILVATSATMTSDAVKLAVDNNIDIIFLDHFGNPFGRIWHCKLGSTNLIRRRQLEASAGETGLTLARTWALEKMNHQIRYLRELRKNHPEKKGEIDEDVRRLEVLVGEMQSTSGTIESNRTRLMGVEGAASRVYFGALSTVLPEKWKFTGRSRDPAVDAFNCMLNYAYGVLYSMVERAIIIAGLDPYVGFVHTDNYNKKSFVFDLIELYRTYADQTVVALFTRRIAKDEMFDKVPNGLTLNAEGKAVLLQSLNQTFERMTKYKGRKVKIRNTMQLYCHSLANDLISGRS